MFIRGNAYLRVAGVPKRWGPLVWGNNVYDVMTSPGVIKTVPAKRLDEALGLDPGAAQNDVQHCRQTAQRLYREGRHEDWVEYSTTIVVPGDSLTEY